MAIQSEICTSLRDTSLYQGNLLEYLIRDLIKYSDFVMAEAKAYQRPKGIK